MKKEFSESALIKAIEGRSAIAAALLYDRYAGTLFRIIILQVRNREIAEEVLEKTLLAIWNNIPEYHLQPVRLLLWMAGIAKGMALQAARQPATADQDDIIAPPVFVPDFNGIALT